MYRTSEFLTHSEPDDLFKRETKEDKISVLTITLKRKHGMAILACHGQIVRNHATRLLCLAVGLHGQDVILDLSNATAIDRSGIGALVSIQAAGIFLRLKDPSEQILSALRLKQVESLFEICRSTPKAVAV